MIPNNYHVEAMKQLARHEATGDGELCEFWWNVYKYKILYIDDLYYLFRRYSDEGNWEYEPNVAGCKKLESDS